MYTAGDTRCPWFHRPRVECTLRRQRGQRLPARTRALAGPAAALGGLCLLLVLQAPVAAAHTNAAPATIREYSIPTAGSLPGGIVAGPDGALWFYETGSNRIGRITTDGQITE